MTIKRSSLNFAIDYLLALTFCAMGGLGILLLTAVPPTRILRDSGIADNRVLLWGLDRHQWGYIHLMVALIFMALLLAHIYFHWPQISCLFRRWTKSKPTKRFVLGPIFILTCLLLLGIPCLLKPALQEPKAIPQSAAERYNQQSTPKEVTSYMKTHDNPTGKSLKNKNEEHIKDKTLKQRKNKDDGKRKNRRHH